METNHLDNSISERQSSDPWLDEDAVAYEETLKDKLEESSNWIETAGEKISQETQEGDEAELDVDEGRIQKIQEN